jgi:hypothetical protein
LLYDGNRQSVTSATISSKFAFHLQDGLYGSFTDDSRVTWSVKFDTDEQAASLLRAVALAKFSTVAGRIEELVVQGGASFFLQACLTLS